MDQPPIDVWDVTSFDPELSGVIDAEEDLILRYHFSERVIFNEYKNGKGPYRPAPPNPYAYGYSALVDEVSTVMESRSIRAWHYTRLTDAEAQAVLRGGIQVSTAEFLRTRLQRLVDDGHLSGGDSEAIFQSSRIHEPSESRSGKFYTTSHPIEIDDSGVDKLLSHWGGEVATFGKLDPNVKEKLATIGLGRVIELEIHVAEASCAYSASRAVLSAYAHTLGAAVGKQSFDMIVERDLLSTAVLALHDEGDQSFNGMGRTFPAGFVNLDIGYWERLTGEPD